MAIVGAQDLWVAGSRLFFTRNSDGKFMDLGTIETANPTFTVETLECLDGDGGVQTTLAEEVTRIDELYSVVTKNISPTNKALMWLADPPQDFVQAATSQLGITHVAPQARATGTAAGGLIKLVDDDALATPIYNLSMHGCADDLAQTTNGAGEVTDMSASASTFTTSTDLSTDLTAAESVIVMPNSMANTANSRSYRMTNVSTKTITVTPAPVADESTITADLIYVANAQSGTIYEQDVDWDIHSDARGIMRILEAGAILADDLDIWFTPTVLAGDRLILPQTASAILGTAYIYWGRGNNAQQTVRQFKASITPNATTFQITDFSNMTFNVKALSNPANTAEEFGRILYFVGNHPATA